jgi:hypothetical protein
LSTGAPTGREDQAAEAKLAGQNKVIDEEN